MLVPGGEEGDEDVQIPIVGLRASDGLSLLDPGGHLAQLEKLHAELKVAASEDKPMLADADRCVELTSEIKKVEQFRKADAEQAGELALSLTYSWDDSESESDDDDDDDGDEKAAEDSAMMQAVAARTRALGIGGTSGLSGASEVNGAHENPRYCKRCKIVFDHGSGGCANSGSDHLSCYANGADLSHPVCNRRLQPAVP